MSKISIVSKHKGCHGSFLNLLDFQDYLIRQGIEVDFYTDSIDEFTRNLLKTKRQYKLGKIFQFAPDLGEINCYNHNVVTDFKTLCVLPNKIRCKKLTIFDNAELTYHLRGITIWFYPIDIKDIRKRLFWHDFMDYIFLMPPSDHWRFSQKYPDLRADIFFKKINVDVLKTIKCKNNKKQFFRIEDGSGEAANYVALEDPTNRILEEFPYAEKLTDLTKAFDYGTYIYYRRKDRAYLEQFGRLIFEFLLLNKGVVFFDEPCSREDGLCDYWEEYKDDVFKMEKDYEEKPWL